MTMNEFRKCETCKKLPFIRRETMRSGGLSLVQFFVECDCTKLIISGKRSEAIFKWNELQHNKSKEALVVMDKTLEVVRFGDKEIYDQNDIRCSE